VRRLPAKQVHDRAALDALLDAAFVVHVAVLDDDGRPYVVPLAAARDGDRLLVHGSTASRVCTYLSTGAPTCATATIVDGVVVARSQFESSLHYRSVMIFGSFEVLDGPAKQAALAKLAQCLLPGLSQARTPSARESAATAMLAMPIREWSLKVSAGPPDDVASDVDLPCWAGVVPLRHTFGEPIDAPDLASGIEVPAEIATWPSGRA
jgi:uncharacterized protein